MVCSENCIFSLYGLVPPTRRGDPVSESYCRMCNQGMESCSLRMFFSSDLHETTPRGRKQCSRKVHPDLAGDDYVRRNAYSLSWLGKSFFSSELKRLFKVSLWDLQLSYCWVHVIRCHLVIKPYPTLGSCNFKSQNHSGTWNISLVQSILLYSLLWAKGKLNCLVWNTEFLNSWIQPGLKTNVVKLLH